MTTHPILNSISAIAVAFLLISGCAAQATNQTQTSNPISNLQQGSGTAQAGAVQNEANAMKLANPALANETAPNVFRAKFVTSKGDFVMEITRADSPRGADRFYNMVKIGYFKDIAIFRAIRGFMFQFGIHGDPAISAKWSNATIQDDANAGKSNLPGTICFAKTGAPNSRSTQMFINLGNNAGLDNQGFTPFGKVVSGQSVLTKINTEYGENRGNVQGEFKTGGNAYILKKFPNIDFIRSVTIVEN